MLAKFGCEGQVAGDDQAIVEKVLLQDQAGFKLAEIWPDSRLEIESKSDRVDVGAQDPINAFKRNANVPARAEVLIGASAKVRELFGRRGRAINGVVKSMGPVV